jgi:phosphotransferase system HPr (HPr) family protein
VKNLPPAVSRAAEITNPRGLHARPCHAIASTALRYRAALTVRCRDREVDGKSILGLMTLGAAAGDTLELSARGEDAQALIEALSGLIASGFSETD